MKFRSLILIVTLFCATFFLTACGKSVDGVYNYYSSDGVLDTLEIKGSEARLLTDYYKTTTGFFSAKTEAKSKETKGRVDKKTITFHGQSMEYELKDGNIIVDGKEYISEKNKEAYDYNLQQFKEFSEELKNYGY